MVGTTGTDQVGDGTAKQPPGPVGTDSICGLCGIKEPFLVAAWYWAPITLNRVPANKEWGQLGPVRQVKLEQLLADGTVRPDQHQCCIIHVALDGQPYCPGCAASRAAHNESRPRPRRKGKGK